MTLHAGDRQGSKTGVDSLAAFLHFLNAPRLKDVTELWRWPTSEFENIEAKPQKE
jgi:hypothetical protein